MMTIQTLNRGRAWAAAMAACLSIAGVSVAQDGASGADGHEPEREEAPAKLVDPAQLLRGPEVVDNEVPGVPALFSVESDTPGMRSAKPITHDVFMKAIMALNSEEATAEMQLTEAQEQAIKAITKAHEKEIKFYRGMNRKKFLRSGRVIRLARKAERDETIETPSEEEVAEAQRVLKELREGAPSPIVPNTYIWDLLSEHQQSVVEAELMTHKMKKIEAREIQRMRRLEQQMNGGPPADQETVKRKRKDRQRGRGGPRDEAEQKRRADREKRREEIRKKREEREKEQKEDPAGA